MSTEPFIGEVKWLAFSFAPRSYMLCQGQTMSIANYTALYALIGTTYGGDGVQTFLLPDLQGRVPVHAGQGPGLPMISMGEKAGSYAVTLSTANLPAHIHTLYSARANMNVNGSNSGENSPDGGYFGSNSTQAFYASQPASGETMAPNMIGVMGSTDIAGSSLPIDITNPLLCINYSIAVEGIFPSRN